MATEQSPWSKDTVENPIVSQSAQKFPASFTSRRFVTALKITHLHFYCFTVHFCSLSFSPTFALIYIIKILSQAVTLIAHFTPTCFDPYGSSSGSTVGPC